MNRGWQNLWFVTALAVAAAISSSASAQQPWKFTALMPLTGPNAGFAEEFRLGLTMAVEHMNQEGGIKGRPVSVDIMDTQSNPGQVASLSRKACEDSLLVFPSVSVESQVAFPVANSMKCPAVAYATGAEGLTAKNRPWGFSMLTPANITTPMAMNAVLKKIKVNSAAVLVERNDPAAMSYGNAAIATMTKNGVKEETISVASTDVDFGPAMTRATSGDPDMVFISTLERAAIGLIKEYRRSQVKSILMLSTSSFGGNVGNMGEDMLDGMLRFSPSDPMVSDDPKVKEFVAAYIGRSSGRPPSLNSTLPYDLLFLTKYVIEKADLKGDASSRQEDRQKYIDELAKVKDWKGLGGRMSMTPDGYMEMFPAVMQYKRGSKWEALKFD